MNDATVSIVDIDVCGKMIKASTSAPISHMNASDQIRFDDKMKHTLTQQLASFMLSNNLIEFTKTQSDLGGVITYRARCCLTPDEQVRKLRVHIKHEY